ncbi:MAG: hypothetical protein U0841_23830 [Chloroflexia bacterium]
MACGIENSIVGDNATLSYMTLTESIISQGAGMHGTTLRLNLGAGSSGIMPMLTMQNGK